MAKNKTEFEVVVETDKAAADLAKLGKAGAKAGDELSKGLAKGAKDASRDIDALLSKVDKLGSGKAANLLLTNNFKQIENDIVDLTIKLNELDASDPEVDVTVTRLAQLEGDLDTVTAKIRELNSTDAVIEVTADTSRVQSSLDGARGKTDELTASANKSRNAFANMVGNVGQDLGALVGITGSAGVGLGQLAEGAADARNEGEGLGSVLKSVATSALPIAALGIGVGLISAAMANAKKKAEEADAAMRRFSDELTDTVGAAKDLDAALDSAFEVGAASEAALVARAFLDALDPAKVQDFRHALSDLSLTNEQFISEFQLAGGTFDQFIKRQVFAAGATSEVVEKVATLVDSFDGYSTILGSADDETADFIRSNETLVTGLDELGLSLGGLNLEDMAHRFLDAQRGTVSETKAIDEAIDSTNTYTDALQEYLEWKQRQNALQSQARAGLEAEKVMWDSIATATQAATDAERERHDQLMSDVAQQQLDDQVTMWESITTAEQDAAVAQQDQVDAVVEGVQAWQDYAASVQEATIEVGKAIDETTDFAGALETEFGKVNDVFGGLAFDVDFKPAMNDALDDLASFRPDFQTLADEWEDILSGKNVEIFGNVRADDDEFLELTGKVRELFQGGIKNEFEQGGVEAANTFAQSVAAQIASKTGLSIAEVYRIMGLPPDGSITTLIEPEVDAQHADQARAILDSLAGVEGGEAREARIHVALETGQIDGDVAYIASLLLAHDALGINVEPQLKDFTPAQIAAAQAVIDGTGGVTIPVTPEVSDNWFDNLWAAPPEPVPVPVALTADGAGAFAKLLDGIADKRRTANIDVKADHAGKIDKLLDAVADQTRTANIDVTADNAGAIDTTLDGVAATRTATITVEAHPAGANSAINGVARPRTAHVTAQAHTAEADRELDNVANPGGQPRIADIYVRTHNTVTTNIAGGGGGSTPVPNLAPAGFAADDEVGINPLAGAASTSTFGSPVSVAGPSFAPTVHNHVTIQAAVIGSRFDVQRAVTKALRQAQRINGGRAA